MLSSKFELRASSSLAAPAARVRPLITIAAVLLTAAASSTGAFAQDTPFKSRNLGTTREGANKTPRTEGDQALVGGWPMYRTERGQTAFNDAMATLKATDSASPSPAAFKDCPRLECNLSLPGAGPDGWVPSGRIWISPSEYVLIAHSPRPRGYSRRGMRDMRYFVFHEFHNSTRNVDTYDTISSHNGSVFVPFYMSKEARDAKGRRFVVVVQVAPYDVVSVHATNMGSAGPGVEVAKSASDPLEPLQAQAGIVLATILKAAAPHLRVVNHHGSEGLPMLNAYEAQVAAARARAGAPKVALPFIPAQPQRVAAASGDLAELIQRRGLSPPLSVAQRGLFPPRSTLEATAHASAPPPMLIGPIRLVTRRQTPSEPMPAAPVTPPSRPVNVTRGG